MEAFPQLRKVPLPLAPDPSLLGAVPLPWFKICLKQRLRSKGNTDGPTISDFDQREKPEQMIQCK